MPRPKYGNVTVYSSLDCDEAQVPSYTGGLSSWVTPDIANRRLVGAANTFRADVKTDATAEAQDFLDGIAMVAVNDGRIVCVDNPPDYSPADPVTPANEDIL